MRKSTKALGLFAGTALGLVGLPQAVGVSGAAVAPRGATKAAAGSSTVYAITLEQTLVSFEASAPGNVGAGLPLTGFAAADESLVGIDVRPATGQLYGLSDLNNLYVVDTASGALTRVGSAPIANGIATSESAFDFNPTVDRIRVANENGQNIRVNPNTGVAVDADANTVGFQPDGNLNESGSPRGASGAAYTNSTRCSSGTALYYIDEGTTDQLYTSPTPNTGAVTKVGTGLGRDISNSIGFDIATDGTAYVSYTAPGQFSDPSTSELAVVDLTTGLLGQGVRIGTPAQDLVIEDIALSLPGTPIANVFPFGGTTPNGVYVASGDVDGDGCGDLVVGTGEGQGPATVQVYSGKTGGLIASATPFGSFAGGVRVATVQATADTGREVLIGAGPGGGPNVQVLDLSGSTLVPLASYFAYDATFKGGVYVASGDVDANATDEAVVGAGAGGGPNVRILTPGGTLLASYFAYAPGFAGGVRVAAGNVDGDAAAEIVTAPGAGGGPNVRTWDVTNLTSPATSFLSGPADRTNGLFVAAGDVDPSSASGEIVTGPDNGAQPDVRVLTAGGTQLSTFQPYGSGFTGGVRVAVGDLSGNGIAGVITGAGPGGGPHVRTFEAS